MKTITIATAFSLAAIMSVSANASTTINTHSDTERNIKRAGAFATPTIAGAMIGGPVGMIVGAFTGIAFSEHASKKHDDEQRIALAHRQALAAEAAAQEALREKARLENPILFEVNSEQLTDIQLMQLSAVAETLIKNPATYVSLNAYADPIGPEEYNQKLSEKRASAVENALLSFGVDSQQIESFSHGERSDITNTDLYTYERRVDISLNKDNEQFAVID